ncbi:MAG TPA: adenine deaminase C-terminal domain-containing protein [Gaiellaceae bacterium]|nr:adenine deaminase C-terminal domain-containing protein [Gaiellaceae bacterium]
MSRRQLIDVAMGKTHADVVVEGGRLVNVATAEIYDADVAIKGDRIAAVGDVAYTKGPETRVIDARGRYLTPGLVEGHLHQYHSYLGVTEYVQALLSHGVTATADGFYGPGIVAGVPAIRFFKEAFERMPIRLIFLVPTLSWLQNRELGLTPTPGIDAADMHEILGWEGCYGLEEPPYLPVVEHYPEFLDLFDETLRQRKVITGHAAGISWRQLQAYAAVGVTTDHESVEVHDALAKARAGMTLLMRQGSGCFDVPEVVRTHTEFRIDPRRLGFCADLASPEKLMTEGTIDQSIRVAIAQGVAPVNAVQMATINTAEAFYAQRDFGVVAPGRFADLVLVSNLRDFVIDTVVFGGVEVFKQGEFLLELPKTEYPDFLRDTVKLPQPITADALTFRVDGDRDEVEVRVIGVTEGSLETDERRARLRVEDGIVGADVDGDVLLLAMIDRFGKGTGIGLSFVQGFRLRTGAIASTANAVCENIVIVGTNATDMAVAANHLASLGGGKVVVRDGDVVASVGLPICGLLTEAPMEQVMARFGRAFEAIAELGCPLKNPFSQLEFCFACGEIGDIKLSEEGLLLITPEPHKVEVVVG